MRLIRKGALVVIVSLACSATAFSQEVVSATQFVVRVIGPGNAQQSSQVQTIGSLRTLTVGREANGQTYDVPLDHIF